VVLAHSARGYLLMFVINSQSAMKFLFMACIEDLPTERRCNADLIYLGANQTSE
jgi:hypothetical protein